MSLASSKIFMKYREFNSGEKLAFNPSFLTAFREYQTRHPKELQKFLALDEKIGQDFMKANVLDDENGKKLLETNLMQEVNSSQETYKLVGLRNETRDKDYENPIRYYTANFEGMGEYFIKSTPLDYHSGGAAEMVQTNKIRKLIKEKKLPIRLVEYELGYESLKKNRKFFVSKLEKGLPTLAEHLQNLFARKEEEPDERVKKEISDEMERLKAYFSEIKTELRAQKVMDVFEQNCFYDTAKDELVFFDLNPEIETEPADEPTVERVKKK